LSTNGTKLAENIDRIADLGFDYVGISLDGIGQMNDWFRGVDGAFDAALAGVRACKARGVKVGLRFTITEDNAHMLPAMMDLCDAEGVDKFYLSHLVYAGRGDKHRGEDTARIRTRHAMDQLIDRAWVAVRRGSAAGDRHRQQRRRRGLFPELGRTAISTPKRPPMCGRIWRPGAAIPAVWAWPTLTRRARCIPTPIGRTTPSAASRPTPFSHAVDRARCRCWPRCASARAR
jgi:MoaA/NifB/PqqE/SkfB family radical SAM enzyme